MWRQPCCLGDQRGVLGAARRWSFRPVASVSKMSADALGTLNGVGVHALARCALAEQAGAQKGCIL